MDLSALYEDLIFKKMLTDFKMNVQNTTLDDKRGNVQLVLNGRKIYKIMYSGKVYYTNDNGYTAAIRDDDKLETLADYVDAVNQISKHASRNAKSN